MSYDEERFAAAISHAGAFSILARLLWVPLEEPLIADCAEGELLDHFAEYCAVIGVEVSGQVSRMREALSGARADVVIALNVESTRLFHTAVDELPAPPYESVWTDGEGLLGGPSTSAVALAYREAGLSVAEEPGASLPDHVSREFEFLAHAARSEARAVEAESHLDAEVWHERARTFMWAHTMRWVPQFFQAIIADGRSEFFGALADAGLLLLESEGLTGFYPEDAVTDSASAD